MQPIDSVRLSFVLILATAAISRAQSTVCASGVVIPRTARSCAQEATHAFACGDVLLRSSTIDLGDWVGQNVRVAGIRTGATCPGIDVRQIGLARATLALCGSPRLGCPIKLVVCPVLQGTWTLWASASPGFFPLGCARIPAGVDGSVLLGPPIVLLAGGALGSCGEFSVTLPVNPVFVGAEIYFQGAHQFIGPVGPLEFTNAQCVRIGPSGPPCVRPGC